MSSSERTRSRSTVVSKDVSKILKQPSRANTDKVVDFVEDGNSVLKIITNDPNDVPEVSAVNLAVVLEELVDQLDVLGRSIGGPEIELRSKPSIELDLAEHRPKPILPPIDPDNKDENAQQERYLLKQHYESVLPRRIRQGVDGPSTTLTRRLSQAIRGSYLNTLTPCGKLMVDRAYLQKHITDLIIDIIQRSTMSSLVNCIKDENENKVEMRRLAFSGIKHKVLMNKIKREIKQTKKEMTQECHRYERIIWSLEDATQELLTRTGMEHAYMKHTGQMIGTRSFKQCKKIEDEYLKKVADAKLDVANEYHVHDAMMRALTSKMAEITAKQEFWMEKYDTDKEELQTDLDNMKADRARDLKRYAHLKFMIFKYGQIVADDRRIKAIEEARRVRSQLEIKRTIKIQAWWRGTMVRNKLGPFRPQKPQKAKKDKGEKKK